MKRALALLAPAVLVVGLVACGGDDDDSPDTTTATADDRRHRRDAPSPTPATDGDDTEAGGSVGDAETDMMQQIFPNLDGDQLDCLVEQVGDSAAVDVRGAGPGRSPTTAASTRPT